VNRLLMGARGMVVGSRATVAPARSSTAIRLLWRSGARRCTTNPPGQRRGAFLFFSGNARHHEWRAPLYYPPRRPRSCDGATLISETTRRDTRQSVLRARRTGGGAAKRRLACQLPDAEDRRSRSPLEERSSGALSASPRYTGRIDERGSTSRHAKLLSQRRRPSERWGDRRAAVTASLRHRRGVTASARTRHNELLIWARSRYRRGPIRGPPIST